MTSHEPKFSKTNFLNACAKGDLEYVKEGIRVISATGISNVSDGKNFGAIHYAVDSHSIECIRLLLFANSFDVRQETDWGETPLILALRNECSIDIIRLLIEFDPALIDIPDESKEYPMHSAIFYGESHSSTLVKLMVETLTQNDLPLIDHVDSRGDSSIVLAARRHHFETIEILIDDTSFGVTCENKKMGWDAFTEMLLRNYRSSDSQSENVCRVLQKLFFKMRDGAEMPLMVHEAFEL